jgi:co-chaperonin GroES (HSP10)
MRQRITKRILLIGLVCISGVAGSTAILAMGTPPQKTNPSVAVSSANAVMLKTDDLRAEPDSTSTALTRVEKGVRVRLLSSRSGWSQVSSAGKTGWVRVLSVSSDARDGIDLADVGALGKTPQGKVVAVAGVRGLDQENLKSASFNAADLALLHTYGSSRSEAEQFAHAAGLQAREMAYLAASKQ